MLPLSRISEISPYSPDWFANRLGKMTSSSIACLCTPKGIGKGGLTYIRNKVSEVITGKSTEKNITNEAILWGIENEPKALQYWRSVTPGVHRMITDTHIVYNERFSSTPDALVMMNEKLVFVTKDGEEFLNCETLESKSYMTPSIHMAHVKCRTAMDIRELNIDLFYQVLSQIHWAGVTRGRCIFFHPEFPESSPYRLGEVIFKKTELMSEFKFFQQRMDEAVDIFQKELNWKP
jgi:hypothetical protein